MEPVYNQGVPILTPQSLRCLWKSIGPPRAKLTLWFTMLSKLKTGDLLVEKGVLEAHQSYCPFCRLEIESNSLVLFTCQFSWNIWMRILDWWGVNGVLHYDCVCFAQQWPNSCVGRRRKKLWMLCFICVIWSIWMERNRVKFESCIHDINKTTHSVVIRIGNRAKELLSFISFSPHDKTHDKTHNVSSLFAF